MRLSRLTAASLVALALSSPLSAQVTFATPETAFDGANKPEQVLETDVAVGPNHVMSVWIDHVPGSPTRVGWALRDSSTGPGTWIDGRIQRFAQPDPVNFNDVFGNPLDRFNQFTDPSVAYSPAANGNPECFMACALATKGAAPAIGQYSCVVVSYYEPSNPAAGWSDWIILDCVASVVEQGIPPLEVLDKPFLVAGAPNEFYATWMSSEGGIHYHYSRTDNGGRSTVSNGGWLLGQNILVNGASVFGFFAMQPSAYAGSDLFCAYNSGGGLTNTKFHFLQGTDAPGMQVNFTKLLDSGGAPVEVVWSSRPDNRLPGTFKQGTVAQPAVDPLDPDHLYVVGAHVENGNDVDIMFNELVRTGSSWSLAYAAPGKLIHNDPAPPTTNCETTQLRSTDQFCPAITVDNRGRIHCVFYDDYRFDQRDGNPAAGCPQPRFNLTHSISTDGGLTFQPTQLGGPAGQVAWMDFNPDQGANPYPGPREYIGIEFVRGLDRSYIWTTVSGHDINAGVSPYSVIWAQLIEAQ